MDVLFWIILATVINGCIALAGALFLLLKDKTIRRITAILIAFSAGTLLGGALLHLLPEAIEEINKNVVFLIFVLGFSVFFLVEKFLHWHHCHQGKGVCPHPFTYLILWGDGIHNFIDGLAIAASFVVDIRFGILTTAVIISHELPQEISDFAVLLHGGMQKNKALLYNFLSQLAAVIGGIVGFYLSEGTNFQPYMLAFTAGGFIYIAASDLIPEIKQERNLTKSIATYLIFLCGILLMILFKFYLGE